MRRVIDPLPFCMSPYYQDSGLQKLFWPNGMPCKALFTKSSEQCDGQMQPEKAASGIKSAPGFISDGTKTRK
jgi:hypothetical protein